MLKTVTHKIVIVRIVQHKQYNYFTIISNERAEMMTNTHRLFIDTTYRYLLEQISIRNAGFFRTCHALIYFFFLFCVTIITQIKQSK